MALVQAPPSAGGVVGRDISRIVWHTLPAPNGGPGEGFVPIIMEFDLNFWGKILIVSFLPVHIYEKLYLQINFLVLLDSLVTRK